MKSAIGLFDSGAISVFVLRKALVGVKHSAEKVNVKVNGRYGSVVLKDKATFSVKLPDISSSKYVDVTAFIEDDDKVVGRHSIIVGGIFLEELGVTLDYRRKTIVWDDISTTMRTISTSEVNSLNDEDPQDVDLPPLMK